MLKHVRFAILLVGLTMAGLVPAVASDRCKVADPTDMALNVRRTPNGEIINRLRNGRVVFINDIAFDNRGRLWAYVEGDYRGEWRRWGWVFREFLVCY